MNYDECRYAKRRPDHMCRDAFGDVIPDGSAKTCFAEARMQILELELAKSLVDDAYAETVGSDDADVIELAARIERRVRDAS